MGKRTKGSLVQKTLEKQRLIQKVRLFFLDPSYSDFCKICDTGSIKIALGDNFELWKSYVIFKYGYPVVYDRKQLEIADKLLTRLHKSPTKDLIDKAWCLFYATGDTNYVYSQRVLMEESDAKTIIDYAKISFDTMKGMIEKEKITSKVALDDELLQAFGMKSALVNKSAPGYRPSLYEMIDGDSYQT